MHVDGLTTAHVVMSFTSRHLLVTSVGKGTECGEIITPFDECCLGASGVLQWRAEPVVQTMTILPTSKAESAKLAECSSVEVAELAVKNASVVDHGPNNHVVREAICNPQLASIAQDDCI